jgi:hypothetical protein
MTSTRVTKSIVLAFALVVLHHATTAAQLPARTDSTRSFWVTGAVGIARLPSSTGSGALTAALGADAQRGSATGSVRWHSLGNGVGGSEIRAVSLLGGMASTTNGAGFWAISGGVSGLRQRECTAGCGLFADVPRQTGPARSGVGVIVAGDGALRIGDHAGASLGFTGFMSLNTRQSFAGIALEIEIGQWR